MAGSSPFKVETVRGTPIQVYGRTLTPVARLASAVRHQGTIREDRVEAWGWGIVHVQPLEVIEERDGQARTLPIPSVTATVLRQMALVALVVPILCMAVVSIARWIRNR